MADKKFIESVAVVGAGGHCGSHIVEALLSTGRHKVTAITRHDSTTPLPDGIVANKVDFDNHESIVNALQGVDALVITLSGFAPKDHQEKLIRAAADANVDWILPNEWSPDTSNRDLVKASPMFASKPAALDLVKELGRSSYIAMVTGFWYQWMLAMSPATFGFDFKKRCVTFFDDGETKICLSTWPQIGRAVASLLSLPIVAEDTGDGKSLEHFRNSHVYIRSFTIHQRQMLESVLRVTGDESNDWSITKQPSTARYEEGLQEVKDGNRMGLAKAMTARVFFADGIGNFEDSKGIQNALFELPEENLDHATKEAIGRLENPFH